jgi:hypothetical protein
MAKLSKNDVSACTPTFLVRQAKRTIFDQCISTKEKKTGRTREKKIPKKKKFI